MPCSPRCESRGPPPTLNPQIGRLLIRVRPGTLTRENTRHGSSSAGGVDSETLRHAFAPEFLVTHLLCFAIRVHRRRFRPWK